MRMSYNTDTFSWDGHQIIAINPDYLENERRKISQMSYREAADYLLFESSWSTIFKRTGWVRKDTDGIVSYILDMSSVDYFDYSGEYYDEIDRTVVTASRDGHSIIYRRYIETVIRHDGGLVEEIEPEITEYNGDQAISVMTEGLWDALSEEQENRSGR